MAHSGFRRGATYALAAALALVAVGVVVQVFLAGLALFGTGGFDAHVGFGWTVHTLGLVALLLATLGPRTRLALGGVFALVVLNALQILLSGAESAAVAALHPTLALAVLGLAGWLCLRVRPA